MSKRQQRTKIKNKKQALKARKEQGAPLETQEDFDFPETVDDPDNLTAFDERPLEDIQKDYYGDYAVAVIEPGPTSWDELDAEELAREQAEEVSEASWDVRMLVSNILHHPEMNADQKSEAIAEVGKGFAPRVNNILSNADTDTVTKDLDLLQIEGILARDGRVTGLAEKVTDIIKRQLSTRGRNKLAGAQFALPEERKYPIHDKAHVRNALARAAQQIKAGGTAAEDAKKALPKIRAAAKQMGIEVTTKSNANAMVIEKDAAGDWRWVGWVSNNFIDWDGDILAESAHQEYVDWLQKNMDVAPVLLAWHTPGTAHENPVDFAACENGFLIMSGKLTEGEAQNLLKMGADVDLGMSHNSFVLERDKDNPHVVLKYRMVEATHLPLDKAANPFTDFETITKEVGMDTLQYLAGIYGSEDKAKAFIEKTGIAKKNLTAAGVASKEQAEEVTETPAETTPEAPKTSVPNMDAILKAIEEQFGMSELSAHLATLTEQAEKVPVLEAVIKEMQTGEDERLAEKLTPPAARYSWMQKARATAKTDTVVKESEEDKKLKKSAPNGNWMTEALGVSPVSITEDATA